MLSILTALKTSVPVFLKNDLNLNPYTTTKVHFYLHLSKNKIIITDR